MIRDQNTRYRMQSVECCDFDRNPPKFVIHTRIRKRMSKHIVIENAHQNNLKLPMLGSSLIAWTNPVLIA